MGLLLRQEALALPADRAAAAPARRRRLARDSGRHGVMETAFAALVAAGLGGDQFALLDIGCSGGIDPRWRVLMDDLARHVADIDIYHTVEDKAAYNGGLFWHTCHYVDAGTSTHRSYPRANGVCGSD